MVKQNLKLLVKYGSGLDLLRSGRTLIKFIRNNLLSAISFFLFYTQTIEFVFIKFFIKENLTTLQRFNCIPLCRSTVFYLNLKANIPPGQNGSSTLATLSEDIEETFERKLYATNNRSHLILHDMNLLLVTTAVDLRNQFCFFLRNPKQEVVRLLKLQVKNYSCRELSKQSLSSSTA